MAESVRRRVRQLERVSGSLAGVCSCGRVRVSYVDADWLTEEERESAPEVCAVCGRRVPTIVVQSVGDWRAVGEPVR